VEYDGTAYAGFQWQPQQPSVQAALEAAIRVVTGKESRVIAAGRTDAGAHALGQVIAFTTSTRLDEATLVRALNAHLPPDIVIQSIETVDPTFHPRFDAISREYHYLLFNRPTPSPLWRNRALHVPYTLELRTMQVAAQKLVGQHDFTAFSGTAPLSSSEHRQCTVRELYDVGVEQCSNLVRIRFVGNAFMKHMIRTIVGTLLRVGSGRMSIAEFEEIFRSHDQRRAGPTVPAYGLYLVRVNYPTESQSQ
jgi:tRNA pseudouridine38-40 synthase